LVNKVRMVVAGQVLDAEFSIQEPTIHGSSFSVVIESKNGQGRNPDYYDLLEEILNLLASHGCVIVQIQLASTVASKHPQEARIVPVQCPIHLSTWQDYRQLRILICRAQSQVLTQAATGSGNSHRRIRIEVSSRKPSSEIFGPESIISA